MAPSLSISTRELIKSMLKQGFGTKVIASASLCSMRAVQRIRLELELPEPNNATTTTANIGRRSCITPAMQDALCEDLEQRPGKYGWELVDSLQDKFERTVSERSIRRTLRSITWTRTTIRRIAQQRDADLRDFYLHTMAQFKSYQLIFVDESGCDRRVGQRRWGWSPKGTSPVEVTKFSRGKRWQILPAYTQEGILLRRVYQGSTDTALFEDFIEQLLHCCGRYPEPRSVIIMDNASWHNLEKIREMCKRAGVILKFLCPYSPDFNPIEEYFGVLKRFIKKHWYENERLIQIDFKMYLEWCVDVVGDDVDIAESHFRHAGIHITQPPS